MAENAPAVWALTSYRAGETSQILALARRLGLPWQRVDLDYLPQAGVLGLARAVSAAGVRNAPPPPWPRLVISAGLRNEPVCRWVQQQSGGATRVVLLGRTWAPVRNFDLVVTTPQYRLAAAPNVLENPLTLHDLDSRQLAAAREQWAERFGVRAGADGQRSVGVLLGGDSGPYAFTAGYARRLAGELNGYAKRARARYLISSSSRTPAGFLEALTAALEVEVDAHRWGEPGANPYRGILAWADELVVTADSIAMISEALGTGKRVLLSEPCTGPTAPLRARLYAGAMRWGHRRWTRDVSLIHTRLLAAGCAERLPEAAAEPPGGPAETVEADYVGTTAAAVRSLVD